MVTITESTRRTIYQPTTPTTVFPVGFPLFDNDDLRVTLNGDPFLSFTVSGTYVNGIATDAAINVAGSGISGVVVIDGYRVPRRTDQYKPGAPLKIEDHNYSLNRVEVTLQELRRDADDIKENLSDIEAAAERATEAANSAEQSAERAEKAAEDAEAAAGNSWHHFDTNSSVQAATIPPVVTNIRTSGYSSIGDGGDALYKRVTSEPVHAGKIRSSDGAWWELAVGSTVNSKQFGVFSGDASAAVRLQNALNYLGEKFNGGTLLIARGNYQMTQGLSFEYALSNINIRGEGKFDTALAYSTDTSGITVGAINKPSRVCIENLVMTTSAVTTGKKFAVRIICNGESPRSVYLKDIQVYGGSVGGTPASGYWDGGGYAVTNPSMPVIHDCLFYGVGGESSKAKASLIDYGFVVQCNAWASGVIHNFNNLFANGCNYGIMLYIGSQPGLEGIFMDSCNFNQTITGIAVQVDAALTSYHPPQFVFDKCQVEPIETGILVIHAGKITVRDTTILMDPWEPVSANAGIVIRDTKQAILSGNFIEFRPGHTSGSAIKIEGSSSNIDVKDNQLNSPGTHIAIFNTASFVTHSGNRFLGAGAWIGDTSSNSATNYQALTQANEGTDVSTNGVVTNWGSVVGTLNASGEIAITFARPFKQNCWTVVAINGDATVGVETVVVRGQSVTGFTARFVGAGAVIRRLNYEAKGK